MKLTQTQIILSSIVIFTLFNLLINADDAFIGTHGWNEGHYAYCAQSFFETGNLLEPRLWDNRGIDFYVPPLYTWLLFFFFVLFGVGEFQARLLSSLFAVGSVIITYFLGKELFDERVGFLGAAFLSVDPLFLLYGRNVQVDSTFTFFLLSSLFFYLKWLRSNSNQHNNPNKHRYFIVALACSCFALLTKQPALIIFPAVFSLKILENRSSWRWKILRPTIFSIISLVPLSLWCLIEYLSYPTQFIFYFIKSGTEIGYFYSEDLLSFLLIHNSLLFSALVLVSLGIWIENNLNILRENNEDLKALKIGSGLITLFFLVSLFFDPKNTRGILPDTMILIFGFFIIPTLLVFGILIIWSRYKDVQGLYNSEVKRSTLIILCFAGLFFSYISVLHKEGHDYYLLPLVPLVSIFCASQMIHLFDKRAERSEILKVIRLFILIFGILFSLRVRLVPPFLILALLGVSLVIGRTIPQFRESITRLLKKMSPSAKLWNCESKNLLGILLLIVILSSYITGVAFLLTEKWNRNYWREAATYIKSRGLDTVVIGKYPRPDVYFYIQDFNLVYPINNTTLRSVSQISERFAVLCAIINDGWYWENTSTLEFLISTAELNTFTTREFYLHYSIPLIGIVLFDSPYLVVYEVGLP